MDRAGLVVLLPGRLAVLTPTHLVTAQTTYLVVCVIAAHPPAPAEAAVALLGGLLPDLDSKASYIGRFAPHTSDWLERQFGHRSFTHSLLVQLAAWLLAWLTLPGGFVLALLSGWVSHSWADMMTKSGVAWFWPARIRCVLPGNPDWRMDVAKGGELVFLLIVALIGLLFMPMAETGKGTAGLIRGALGDLEMARGEYDRDKGDYHFSVEITGRDNIDHSDISGTYPVTGPWTTAGFILDTDQGPRSLCAGSACNWFGSHVKLNRGARIATSTLRVDAPLIRIDQLQQQAATLAETGSAYLLGTAQAEGVKPRPPTLEAAGNLVSFHYASPAILERLAGRTLANAELVWQVRHPPGAELPAIDATQPQRASIPPLLQRWLEDQPSASD